MDTALISKDQQHPVLSLNFFREKVRMSIEQRIINSNFDGKTNALLSQFIAEKKTLNIGQRRRDRVSRLDQHVAEILSKRALKWSFERVATYLSAKYGVKKINRSTVMRRIQKFYENS